MTGDARRPTNADALRPPQWLRWAAVAVVAGGIFYASLLAAPDTGLPPLGPLGTFGMDKWLHALAYAGLAGTLAVALAPGRTTGRATTTMRATTTGRTTTAGLSAVRVAVLALVLATGYGVGIEFVQAPLPKRYFSVVDMVANATGAVSGALGWRVGLGFVGRLGVGIRSEA